MTNTQNTNEEDLKKQAQARGQKLGFLINALNVPQEQKQAWLTLLPEMSLEQIERLADILENQYLQQQTKAIDKDLEKDLSKIKDEHNQALKDLDKQTIDKIKNLSDKI